MLTMIRNVGEKCFTPPSLIKSLIEFVQERRLKEEGLFFYPKRWVYVRNIRNDWSQFNYTSRFVRWLGRKVVGVEGWSESVADVV